MTSDDVAVLRELSTSVYLTPRQRLALGRLLARVELPPVMVAGAVLSRDVEMVSELKQRAALLGPCGAE